PLAHSSLRVIGGGGGFLARSWTFSVELPAVSPISASSMASRLVFGSAKGLAARLVGRCFVGVPEHGVNLPPDLGEPLRVSQRARFQVLAPQGREVVELVQGGQLVGVGSTACRPGSPTRPRSSPKARSALHATRAGSAGNAGRAGIPRSGMSATG